MNPPFHPAMGCVSVYTDDSIDTHSDSHQHRRVLVNRIHLNHPWFFVDLHFRLFKGIPPLKQENVSITIASHLHLHLL